jgi:hypothetical protein
VPIQNTMKTTSNSLRAFLALCALVVTILSFGPARADAQSPADTKWTLISTSEYADIYCLLGVLPRENAPNPSQQSSTWAPAMTNWRDNVLLGGMESAGVGFENARRLSAIDYNLMVTSSAFQSWHAAVHTGSTTQFGNRHHLAIAIIGKKSTWNFMPTNMTVRMKSYVWNSAGTAVLPDTVVNSTATFSAPLNEYRLRLDSAGAPGIDGDVRSADQGNATPTNRFLYVGSGFAGGAYGTGTQQEQLDRPRNYGVSKNLMVEVLVTVPGLDGDAGRTVTGQTVLLNQGLQQPAVTETAGPSLPFGFTTPERTTLGSDMIAGEETNVSQLYLMQRSADLGGWSGANTVALFGNNGQLVYPTPFMPESSREFARIVTTIPAPPAAGAAPLGQSPELEAPKGDDYTP